MLALNAVVTGALLIAFTGSQVAAVRALSLGRNGTRVVKRNAACDGSLLSASVTLPSDAGYDAARAQWASGSSSSAIADARLRPQMIISCSSDSHVQEVVSFAKSCGFEISVRSGGHNYAAYSSCPEGSPNCIQVDVSALETFAVDTTTTPKTVTLGVGLTLQQAYAQLLPYGLAIQAGVCNTVGVGGHFQTSGMGWFQRAFGAGLDSVKSFRIVLADGAVHSIDVTSDPDLYWAVLGGGPGSWGIVLDYTIDTWENADYPYSKTWSFMYPYSRSTLLTVGNLYSTAMADTSVSRDLLLAVFVHAAVLWNMDQHFDHLIYVRGVWVGRDNGDMTPAQLQTFYTDFTTVPGFTSFQPVTPMPLSYFGVHLATDWNLGPFRHHIHAFGMRSLPSANFWEAMADECDIRDATPELRFSLQLMPWNGQIANNAGKNAYAVRDAVSFVDDWVFFLTDSAAQIAEDRIKAFREATGHFWEEDGIAHSWMTPDTLINNTHNGAADFANARLKARLARSAGDWDRLVDVKTRVDPTDIFHTAMTIPPRASASAAGDPHLQNIYGQRFDLMQPGWHTLLEIPRQAATQRALLLVEAEAYHEGSACADMYFQSLNITGEWAQEKQRGGLHFSARDSDGAGSAWMSFGGVDVKVKHGRTLQGTRYLNLFVKHLAKTGYAIGGLLGEDDHTTASTLESPCQRSLSLAQVTDEGAAWSAEASLE